MKPSAQDLIRAAPKYLGTPYSKLDCQAFVERCLTDIGIDLNLAGSNAWFRKMTWVGTPDECKKKFGSIPKGAFLFILKQDGGEVEKGYHDGIGNASHIGIYTGMTGAEMCDLAIGYGIGDADIYNFGNGAIHSSSSRGHVCTSTFAGKAINGGWNRIGLWEKISYGGKIDELLGGKESNSEGGEGVTATVYAPEGQTVNVRMKPSTSASLVERLPVGTQVEIISESGDWAYIESGNVKGYMMSKYLKVGQIRPGEGESSDFVSVPRTWLQNTYDQIGEYLGIKG